MTLSIPFLCMKFKEKKDISLCIGLQQASYKEQHGEWKSYQVKSQI
jgi:hypothetical protein